MPKYLFNHDFLILTFMLTFTEKMNFYVRDNNSMFKYLFLCNEQFV